MKTETNEEMDRQTDSQTDKHITVQLINLLTDRLTHLPTWPSTVTTNGFSVSFKKNRTNETGTTFYTIKCKTRPDTRLPKSRAGGQGQ